MKGYFRASFIAAALLAALSGIFISGCTDVDDSLGLDLVPDDQLVDVQSQSFTGIGSYVAFSDSIPTSRLRRMVMGSMETDFGRTTVRSVHQFMPLTSYKSRGDYYFGGPKEKIVLDSAYIVLYIGKITGDTRVPQTFQFFPLRSIAEPEPGQSQPDTSWINFERSYYPYYDMTGKYESEPVFEVTLEKEIEGARYKKLWPVDDASSELYAKGKEYLEHIVGLDQSVWKDEEEGEGLFHEAVPGFYIAPKDVGNAIYEILMIDSYYRQDLSYISIYTHNTDDGEDAEALETKFYFDDKATVEATLSNLSIALIDHDYTLATNGIDPGVFLRYEKDCTCPEGTQCGVECLEGCECTENEGVMPDIYDEEGNEIIPQQEKMYVQSMVGVSGYISFDDELKAELSRILDYDDQYKGVFINRAKLILPLAYNTSDPSYLAKVTRFPARLGLYYDNKGDLPVSMPDYPYMEEIINGTESSFGGYLNYSKAQYEMDISTYVRQLILNPEFTRSQLWIAPAYSASTFSRLEEVELQNKVPNPSDPDDASREIKLEITYTLIK